MNKKDYIREKIYQHMRFFELTISNELLDDMLNSSSFAFRLLYDEYYHVNNYQLLNPKDLVYKEGKYNNVWSIDGGVRFQWFPREILSIDIKDFREERIGSILD